MAARSMMAPLKANPPRCPRGAPGAARSGRKAFRIAREGMNMMRVEGRSAAGGVACSATAAGGSALSPEEMARFADIIRKPILTETTTKAIEDNKYYFEVRRVTA